MAERIAGFKGEYLWELDVADWQLSALVEAIPADRFGWRPVEGARSVSEVLVHIAANFALLDAIGVPLPTGLYPPVEGEGTIRFLALCLEHRGMESTVIAKDDVVKMLKASLAAVRAAITDATGEELDRVGIFFGEQTTVRRVYMRILAHTHEHMGQMIAYTRTMGLPAPWPDPVDMARSLVARA